MIWESKAAMTALDLLVLCGVAATILLSWQLHRRYRAPPSRFGLFLIPAGLALLALFFLADLVVMHAFPAIIGEAATQSLMTFLHLNSVWVVMPLAIGLLCAGMLEQRLASHKTIAALAASEERYRTIVQDQSEMIVRWLPGGIRTWVNDPYCRTFGARREDLVGTSFFPLIDEAHRESVIRSLAGLTPETPAHSSLHKSLLPGGGTGWQEWIDRAVFDSDGQIVEIQSVGRDVTQRVNTALALEESEARFRGLVESTSDWVWEMDAAGRHTYSNARIRDVLGYTSAELLGIHWRTLVHPDDIGAVEQQLELKRSRREGWQQWKLRLRHRNGSYRYLESSAVPRLADDGTMLGYRGIDRDITFSALMSDISTRLVGCRAGQLKSRIEQAFEDVATAYGLEKVTLWLLDESRASLTYCWQAPRSPDTDREPLEADDLPWITDQLRSGAVVRLETLDDLPRDVPDRQALERLGVKSVLDIPSLEDGRLVGIVAFLMYTRERRWSDRTVTELRHLAEKIVAAHNQVESARRIAQNERDLAQSEALAEVGSFAYYPMVEDAEFPEQWHARFSAEQRALFELGSDEASFDAIMARVHEGDRGKILDATERLFGGATEVELEFRAVCPSGKIRYIHNRTRLDRDEDGRALRIIGANRDITGQVRKEQALSHALQEVADLKDSLALENTQLREEVRTIRGFEGIVGNSAPLRRCFDLVARSAPTDLSVLILGETGTGKELIANAFHELSARRERRMISLNCATLPPELVESELFGHEKGAFTGAVARRQGRFELAHGGTLFLDEIGDLPLRLQSKLLRVIESGEFERVGGTETLRVDVRIIAATNRDLEKAVQTGEFRSDLYFRINTVSVLLPPLRERRDDIPSLAQHFVTKHGPRLNKRVDAISAGLLRELQSRDWPGNVRELENFIERCLISSEGTVLTTGDFAAWSNTDSGASGGRNGRDGADDLAAVIAGIEREHIERVLTAAHWVIDGAKGAASRLGVPASTLRYKMKKLGIARPH